LFTLIQKQEKFFASSLVRFFRDFLFVKRLKKLVEMSRIHGIPPIQFRDGSQMHKPVHLDRLQNLREHAPEPNGRLRNLEQFGGRLGSFSVHRHFTAISAYAARTECATMK
jgi:hypothetical protein